MMVVRHRRAALACVVATFAFVAVVLVSQPEGDDVRLSMPNTHSSARVAPAAFGMEVLPHQQGDSVSGAEGAGDYDDEDELMDSDWSLSNAMGNNAMAMAKKFAKDTSDTVQTAATKVVTKAATGVVKAAVGAAVGKKAANGLPSIAQIMGHETKGSIKAYTKTEAKWSKLKKKLKVKTFSRASIHANAKVKGVHNKTEEALLNRATDKDRSVALKYAQQADAYKIRLEKDKVRLDKKIKGAEVKEAKADVVLAKQDKVAKELADSGGATKASQKKAHVKDGLAKLTGADALNKVAAARAKKFYAKEKIVRLERHEDENVAARMHVKKQLKKDKVPKVVAAIAIPKAVPTPPPYSRKALVPNDHKVRKRVAGYIKKNGKGISQLEKNALKLKAYCIAANSLVESFAESHFKQMHGIYDFVLAFARKPKKAEKHAVSMQYAEICDTTHSWFPKGVGNYAMDRMEHAVETKSGPLLVTKFQDSVGDRLLHGTYVMFNGQTLGFATATINHFKRVAVKYSAFATAYAKVLHDFKKDQKSVKNKAGKSTGMTRVAYEAAAMRADCEIKHSDCENDLGRVELAKKKAKTTKKAAKKSVKKLQKAAKKGVKKAVAKKAAKKVIKKLAKKKVKKLVNAAKKQIAAKTKAKTKVVAKAAKV